MKFVERVVTFLPKSCAFKLPITNGASLSQISLENGLKKKDRKLVRLQSINVI